MSVCCTRYTKPTPCYACQLRMMADIAMEYKYAVFVYLDVYAACRERPASEFLMLIAKKNVKIATYRDKFLPFQIEK